VGSLPDDNDLVVDLKAVAAETEEMDPVIPRVGVCRRVNGHDAEGAAAGEDLPIPLFPPPAPTKHEWPIGSRSCDHCASAHQQSDHKQDSE
jgi:hypothetical protein